LVALVPVIAGARNRIMDAKSSATFGAGRLAAVEARTAKSAGRAGARGTGKQRSRMSGTRTGLLVVLLAGGALVGAARVLRSRRDRSRWETNESPGVDGPAGDAWSVPGAAKSTEDRRPENTTDPLTAGSGKSAEKAST
jgi:hypothetical protein